MKRFVWCIVLLLGLSIPSFAQQNLVDTDNFGNGSPANNTPLTSYTPLTGTWTQWGTFNTAETVNTPTAGVSAANSAGGLKTGVVAGSNDQWAALTVDGTSVSSSFWVCVRADSSRDAYCSGVDTGSVSCCYAIVKFTGGVPASLTTAPTQHIAANDVVNVQVVGNPAVVTLKVNGIAPTGCSNPCQVTDSTSPWTTGNPAFLAFFSSAVIRVGGNWQAGNVGGGGGSSSPAVNKRTKLQKLLSSVILDLGLDRHGFAWLLV